MSDYSNSGSDSDDEAPEQITLSSARQHQLHDDRKTREAQQQLAQAKKAKNKATDAKRKQAAKGKAKLVDDFAEQGLDEDELEEDDEEPAAVPQASSSKINYLDPALLASAATYYEPEAQPEAGKGKMAAKRAARAERQARNAALAERNAQVGEGGARNVGNLTLQHLSTPTHTSHSLSTTALPSHTSATKFLTNRLYSKKRALAVLDAGKPRVSEESGRKRKKGKGSGMSAESRALLGMGMDDGAKEKEDADEKERQRKRSLLLQAEGKRKAVTLARPLASARSKGKPASQFAVATRTR